MRKEVLRHHSPAVACQDVPPGRLVNVGDFHFVLFYYRAAISVLCSLFYSCLRKVGIVVCTTKRFSSEGTAAIRTIGHILCVDICCLPFGLV